MTKMKHNGFAARVYFGAFDRVHIGGLAFEVANVTSEGYLLVSERENAPTQLFTHSDLQAQSQAGKIRVERDYFAPKLAEKKRANSEFIVGLLEPEHREKLGIRWAYCQALALLRQTRKVKLTHSALTKAIGEIKLLAEQKFSEFSAEYFSTRKVYGGRTCFGLKKVSSSSLINWFGKFRKKGLAGLVDHRWKSGRKGSRLCHEAETLLAQCVARYLNPDQPTQVSVIEDTRRCFAAKNLTRSEQGLPLLPVPSKNTILRRIKDFTPFEVVLNREGREEAMKQFFPVGEGLQMKRPLERVEMDGWTVDLITLAKSSGLLGKLNPDLVEEMELDGGKKRWHLFASVCCVTKCFLGLTLSKTENAAAAVDCMQMMVRDKGQWADAVGALSPWSMHGMPDLLVTDNGAAFGNYRFIGAAQDIGLDLERAPAGLPQMRANIERVFRTVSTNLVARLSGRTFSDVVARGEYPSEERAVLTVQDFADVLTRWVVDVYHNTPHEGLGGETPLECWNRLSAIYGVRPGPDLRSRRIAFGISMSRKLSNVGVQIMGVRYNNELLMEHLRRSHDRKLDVRWLPENLGEIEVRIGEEWHAVPSVLSEFRNRTARDWTSARNRIRAGDPKLREASDFTIARAFSEIDRLNKTAGERAGILSERWDAAMVERFENNTLIGFKVAHEAAPPETSSGFYGKAVDVSEPSSGGSLSRPETPSRQESAKPKKSIWKF